MKLNIPYEIGQFGDFAIQAAQENGDEYEKDENNIYIYSSANSCEIRLALDQRDVVSAIYITIE